MSGEWRRAAARHGRLGRIGAIAATLAAGLLLALASAARGEAWTPPSLGLSVVGGEGWRAENDFDVFWVDPAGGAVSGASWRLEGPGYQSAPQFVAGAGIAELPHLHVPAAGEWDLGVWLRDDKGVDWEAFEESIALRLDDVAPVLSFMPGDAQASAPQLVAAVADPLSGVADGTISYRRLGEERWADLPTAIRTGVFGTELAAARPDLEPGTAYEFRAEARDHAGNVAETTVRADGAPMQFTAPRGSSGPDRGGGRAAGRRTRLSARLACGRCRGGRSATVDGGSGALLRGTLADAGGGLEGRRLRVAIRPASGTGGRSVELVTTGPAGRFRLRLPPGPSRRLTVSFPGGEGLASARRRLELRVRAAVSLRAAPRRLRNGERLRLEGRVGSRGARLPRPGKLVTISYWEEAARRWRPVIVTRSDRAGRFRAEYRFRYVSGRARIRLRATAPAEADWPYAPGSSPPLTVEVSG